MLNKSARFKLSLAEAAIIFVVFVCGLAFIWYQYHSMREQNHRIALQLGNSVVAALPVAKIDQLEALPGDTAKPVYQELKAVFLNVIKENTNARFAYLYVERHRKYYFLLDSEPPGSLDYSPPGQEFSEVAETDKQPFVDGKSIITPFLTDRWGTWISVLVPVKDRSTGKIVAVFGMDISARSWKRALLWQVAESSALVLVLIILGLLTLRFFARNRHLKNEIGDRMKAEKALSESEERYRLLYENASIGIYQTTPDGKVLLSNQALIKILGYKSLEEIKERDIENEEFDATYSRAEFKAKMESEGEIHGLESIWKRQDGALVYIRENAKAVRDPEGKIVCYDGTIEDITDRKLAEKALQYSEERFKQIAEQSREVVWETDTKGVYTYISPLSQSVLGYSPEQLIGKKHFFDLHPEDTRDDFRKAALDVFRRKASFHDYINQVVKGTGENIWVMTNGVPILNEKGELTGYRGADSDITERIERESLLKKLTLAVEQSSVSIVITDVNGAIEYGNPKACETTGYTPEELAGQNPRILKSGIKSSTDYAGLWKTILSGKIWHGEFLNKRKNGELYWESASISPIYDDEGNIINFLAIKEDITNMKKLIRELQEAKEKAESGDALKTAFIKNISHEIRTPLNGIVGMSEQIIKSSVSQQNKELLLEHIKESSSRLISTVNSYMDISMLMSGNVVVQIRPFDVNSFLKTIRIDLNPVCLSKNLELKLIMPAEEEVFFVNSDKDILSKIFMNLLDNAVKFTYTGSISFGYNTKNDSIEFFIKDTGVGIAENYLPRIFDAFSQADVSDTRAFEGSGLGLAIAYRLIKLLSGEIRVESEISQGTTFYLTFHTKNNIDETSLQN